MDTETLTIANVAPHKIKEELIKKYEKDIEVGWVATIETLTFSGGTFVFRARLNSSDKKTRLLVGTGALGVRTVKHGETYQAEVYLSFTLDKP